MTLEYLQWDSEFFNRKIGRIIYNEPEEKNLKNFIKKAKSEHYQLLYVFSPENLYISESILAEFSGKLVDRKVLYFQNLMNERQEHDLDMVIEYPETEISEDLQSLAYLSGAHSRFFLDKNFKPDDFYHLYKTWMQKSLTKEMADKTFVILEKEKIQGMVTLKCKQNVGEIGLIAVDNSTQGKGYGKKLVNACINELISKDIFKLEVPTQQENTLACRFYEKCGFKTKNITNIYHFWL